MKKIDQNNMEAKKATIYLGNITLNVYQMPDGSYKLSIDSLSDAIGEERDDLLRFKESKSELAVQFKNYHLFQAPLVIIDDPAQFFKPIPVELATSYWFTRAMKGNQIAQALVQACMIESIERRADKAFELKRTEEEYNRRWSDNYEEILNDLRQ